MTKDKKLKVPKRIAGVKVPKKLRKPVNKALAIAENPATRDLAVAALTAAAAALARKGADAAQRAQRPGEPGTDPDRAGKLGDVIIAAALDGARRLLDPAAGADTPAADNDDRPKRARAGRGSDASAAGPPATPQDA